MLLPLWMTPAWVAKADDPPETKEEDKTKSDQDAFSKALDQFEEKLIVQERHARYGNDEVEAYADELEQEFRDNAARLQRLRQESEPDERLIGSAKDREQHLSLLLWQLQRTGGTLGKTNDRDYSKVHLEIHKLLSEHRTAMKDPQLMKRFRDLSQRSSALIRLRAESRMMGNFHFVRPLERELETGGQIGFANADGETQPLDQVRKSIGMLFQLCWKDGRLHVDRDHWSIPFAGKSLEEIDREIRTELESRGLEIPEVDRSAAFRQKQLFETPPAMLLFQDMQYQVTSSNPRYTRRMFQPKQASFSAGGLSADLRVTDELLELFLREESGEHRTLEIRYETDGELRIRLVGDHVFLLSQSDDAKARFVFVGEDVVKLSGDSFASLYGSDPDRTESILFKFLEDVGIGLPIQRKDVRVAERIQQRKRGINPKAKEDFQALLDQLDSSRFSDRQKAQRKLSENAENYSLLIAGMPTGTRSAETNARLDEIRKQYNAAYQEIDSLINQAGWLDE